MASSKRKSDDSDSDWEGAKGAKQPKPSPASGLAELQGDRGNYGTLSSQRPTRVRKPPERYINAPPQPAPKKKKSTSTSPATLPKKPSAALKRNDVDVSPRLPERESKIVRLKVPSLETLRRQSIQQHINDNTDSELSSLPGSLPSSPICTLKNTQASLPLDGQGQCDQRIPEPVPASSQDLATPSVSQNSSSSQAPSAQSLEPKTPENDTRGIPGFANYKQTPSSVPSADVYGRFAYLTPASTLRHDLSLVHDKSNVELEDGRVLDPDSYLTQPTLPLNFSCEKCGRTGHTERSCPAAGSALANPDHTRDIEAWLRAGDSANQIKPPCSDHVGSVPSLYAASEATTECDGLVDSPVGEQDYVPDNKHLRDLTEQLLAQQNKGPNKPEPYG